MQLGARIKSARHRAALIHAARYDNSRQKLHADAHRIRARKKRIVNKRLSAIDRHKSYDISSPSSYYASLADPRASIFSILSGLIAGI